MVRIAALQKIEPSTLYRHQPLHRYKVCHQMNNPMVLRRYAQSFERMSEGPGASPATEACRAAAWALREQAAKLEAQAELGPLFNEQPRRQGDAANRSLIEVKRQLQAGEPRSVIGRTDEKVEELLSYSRDPIGW